MSKTRLTWRCCEDSQSRQCSPKCQPCASASSCAYCATPRRCSSSVVRAYFSNDFAFLVLLLAVAAASCIAFVASREASGWKHETTPVAGLGSTSLSAACRGTHGGAALRFGGEGLKLRCGMHCADHGHQARRIDPTHQAQEEVRLHCLLLLSSASTS